VVAVRYRYSLIMRLHTDHGKYQTAVTACPDESKDCDDEHDKTDNAEKDAERLNHRCKIKVFTVAGVVYLVIELVRQS